MELLAPAGTLAVFETAVKNGADAVYIGAPALNARALSSDFSMADIAAMVEFAHRHEVKLHVAMNTLVKEAEIPLAIETIALLDALHIDGIILQDLGIYGLIKKYFPHLRIHASTLLGAHNSVAVRQFEKMGFDRVVLAREMPVNEIRKACQSTVEIEVFIHGALCFSYSGLCIFSSFLGGKSGLRGRCVQPCRRRYQWAGSSRGKSAKQKGNSGYFFSMNDLCGIELLPQLRKAGVTSLKIEGRLRSAHYVGTVVQAYRTALNGMTGDQNEWNKALEQARHLLRDAMGRRTSAAFLQSAAPTGVVSPYHSGNVGIFLGKFGTAGNRNGIILQLKSGLSVGDRVRLHQEKSGERVAFTLKNMKIKGQQVETASRGDEVVIETSEKLQRGDSLYKVDSKNRRAFEAGSKIQPGNFVKKIRRISSQLRVDKIVAAIQRSSGEEGRTGHRRRKIPELWLKIDNLQVIKHSLPFRPERLLVTLSRESYKRFDRGGNFLRQYEKRLTWALPPIIHEADLSFYRKAITQLSRNGYCDWQIGHCSQVAFFSRAKRCRLSTDYTVNVLNSETVKTLQKFNIQNIQLHIETDKTNLQKICSRYSGGGKRARLGLTVYSRPPLFTARLDASHFRYNRLFISPKGEKFVLTRKEELTLALPERPFSLINELGELASLGISYAVIDLTNWRPDKKEMEELGKMLSGRGTMKWKQNTFNYHGNLP